MEDLLDHLVMVVSSLSLLANLQRLRGGGGFFWTKIKDYKFARTRHFLFALVNYKNFKYQRYLAYEKHKFRKNFWHILWKAMCRLPINIENDRLEKFESYILGGVLDANLDEAIAYRTYWTEIFSQLDLGSEARMLTKIRGISNNCKIVLLFSNLDKKKDFIRYIEEKKIAYFMGYAIPKEADNCINAKNVEGMIVELPIDQSEVKMKYLHKCISDFFLEARCK